MREGFGAGRKRPPMQPNYHTMTNNAVFPTDDKEDVIHYHSKVLRDNKPKLAPTLRPGMSNETAQIHQG